MAKTIIEDESSWFYQYDKNTVAEIKEAISLQKRNQQQEELENQKEAVAESKATADDTFHAGKRSKKAADEKAAADAKEERKASDETEQSKPKQPQNPTRSRLERRSKRYKAAHEKLEAGKNYTIAEATKLAIDTSSVKFDATVEFHIRLNVDPKQADQNIRDTLVMPADRKPGELLYLRKKKTQKVVSMALT